MLRRDQTDVPEFADGQLRDIREKIPPRAPLQAVAENTGNGVRITVVNDGPLGGRLNGAVRYDVYWTDDVDTTTTTGKAAGFARAVCLAPSIPATNIDHTQSSALFADPKYATGFFYVCGVDADASRSEPTEPIRVTTGPTDATIPGDVRHLQISESGLNVGGVIFSELSVTCEPPIDASNLGGVQLYLQDYTALGDTQEGYFHRWFGSGGINFAVPYPIPRRRSTAIDLTATNSSDTFTAASGLLSVAKVGELLEMMGERLAISDVTDTTITTTTGWTRPTVTTSDFVIIGKPRIYVVSVSKAGTRRADIENAPYVDVLMDGDISTPNAPANVYITNTGVDVVVEWDQVAGNTIDGYNVYRSDGSSVDSGMSNTPPIPAAGTVLLDKVKQNPNVPEGSTYARLQFHDSKFTPYDLEVNAAFVWYVTTTNTRGDESSANASVGNCRQSVTNEIDPTQVGRNPGKNYVYNAVVCGTAGNQVLANDVSQDFYIATDAANLPGRPYGSASGQANGLGRFRGYTRWESNDGGSGAAGICTFENGDEIHIPAPGSGKFHYVYQEIGAWQELSGNAYLKLGKGEVYTLSAYLNHTGVATNGILRLYVEQYANNVFGAQSKRRYRDTNSNIVTSATALEIAGSEITSTSSRYQAAFQLDSAINPTRQVRVNFQWDSGTTGVVAIRRVMFNPGEAAAQWTADMGDTTIALPVPANPIDPEGDVRTIRVGDARKFDQP